MYKIALIQNESEMMRYSWADIRPMVDNLGYQFDGFTAENIEKLFPRLKKDTYDAIIIASNACNDETVRLSLDNHCEEIESFLDSGKGLFVSFQMKMPEFSSKGFLPEGFRVSAHGRIANGEHPKEGDISIGQGQEGHTIVQFPETIDVNKVRQHSLTNNLVEGIYWIYMKPKEPENYNIILEDPTYTPSRPLLLTSREDYSFRVAISALALDWQKHEDLWKNTIRYIVEGRPSIAVVNKAGRSVFDFQYLLASFEINKLPYAEYSQEVISPDDMSLDVHDTFLLDPSWQESDIEKFVQATSDLIQSGQARVFYFGRTSGDIRTLQAVSNVREYQTIAKNATTWLISQFPDDPQKGYWEGSFWCTVDVLKTLREFEVPLDGFKKKVLEEIEKHDKNGSYDEVLGASCALLEIYNLFLGSDHTKTKRTRKWIMERVYDKTLFERATAYEVLTNLDIEISESQLLDFRNDIQDILPSLENEFMLYRFGKTLLTCGFTSEAEQIALQLEHLQDKKSGKWVNIPNTAAIVSFLIDLQGSIKGSNKVVEEMIFKGVQFLRRNYTPNKFSWKSDASATAKSLLALKAFEQRITFPIDVVMNAMRVGDVRAKNYVAIEAASELNVKLQRRVNQLSSKIQEKEKHVKDIAQRETFSSRLSSILVVLITFGSLYVLFFTRYLAKIEQLPTVLKYLREFSLQHLPVIVTSPIAIIILGLLIYFLRKTNKLPDWLEAITSIFLGSRKK